MMATLLTVLNEVADSCGGLLLVALFFWFRFHTRKGTRSYTTRGLYCFGVAIFLLPFVLAYWALTSHEVSSFATIWLLIVAWGLTPWVPGMWRKLCHDLAQIPSCAYRLRDTLATAPFEVRPADMAIIRRKLGRYGYQVDDFPAVQRTVIQSRFLKIAALMHYLEQWSAKPEAFSWRKPATFLRRKPEAFMRRNAEVYADLLSVFDLLCLKVNRTLTNTATLYGAVMENSKVGPDDWHALDVLSTQGDSSSRLQSVANAAAGCMLEDLRKDMDFLLDKLLLFVARATLAGERNFAHRRRRLEAVGFTISRKASSITATIFKLVAITFTFTLIWLSWFFLTHDLGATGEQQDTDKVLIELLTLPSVILVVNVLAVYYFKRHYAFASEGLFGGYPFRFILSVGFLTALLTLPFRCLFDSYLYNGSQLTNALICEAPMSIYSWATGAALALLVQDSMWNRFKSERMQQLMDGVAFGASMTLAVAVQWAIDQLGRMPQMHIVENLGFKLGPGELLASTFIFGFVIGYLVIGRLRQALSLFRGRTRVAPSAVLIPA
jgi:hypothetical protein